MKKSRLIELLKDVPDDAVITVWNEAECDHMPVTDVVVENATAFGTDTQVKLLAMW